VAAVDPPGGGEKAVLLYLPSLHKALGPWRKDIAPDINMVRMVDRRHTNRQERLAESLADLLSSTIHRHAAIV